MYSSKAKIFVSPKDLWDYFDKNRLHLLSVMEPVAQNSDFDVIIYVSNDRGLPLLTIESSNVDSVGFPIESKNTCEAVASKVYELYLTEQIVSVMMEEIESETEELDIEDVIAEREADIDSFFERLIDDLFGVASGCDTVVNQDVINDCKEHLLEYLYRKHGLSVYRPMELEDDEGVFVEDYPYEYMEFEPCSLYDEVKK